MRTKYSVKNFILQFLSNIISIIFLFASHTVFIKTLGVAYNGLNGLFTNLVTILGLLELGIGSSITYNLYQYIKKDDIKTIKSIMKFYKKVYGFIAILVFLVGLLFFPFLKLIVHDAPGNINVYYVYLLFLLAAVASYVLSYKRDLIIAHQKNYIASIIQIIYTVFLHSTQIIILIITNNFYLYLIIKIIWVLLENILINYIANRMYPYLKDKQVKVIDPKVKEKIINKVKALVIHKASLAVTNGTDNILISIFLGIKTVGLYTIYNYIITSVKKIFGNIIQVTTPSIGNLLLENNYEKNYQAFKRINFLNFWIATLTSVCLLLITEPFITLWLGKKNLLAFSVLLVLVINYFQMMMRSSYNAFKDAAGIWVEDRIVPLIQLSINLITSIILLKIFGLKGVFMGTIICNFTVWFYSYPKYIYKGLFNREIKKYYKELLSHLLIFAIILTISWFINIHSINIITSVIISIIVPNLLLFIIYFKSDEFKYYKNLIMRYRKK